MQTLSRIFTRFFQRWLPDPFSLAILLTLVSFGGAFAVSSQSATVLFSKWYEGIFKIFQFTIEMALILVCGRTIADSRWVRLLLDKLVTLPQSDTAAVLLVFFMSALASWINWGFGLVVAGILSREVGKRIQVDFAYLVACGYSGFVVWHSGLSGSIPLVLATPGHALNPGGRVTPITETVFSQVNLGVTLLVVVVVAFALLRAKPRSEEVEPLREGVLSEKTQFTVTEKVALTPAERLDGSPLLSMGILFLAGVAIYLRVMNIGFRFDLPMLIYTLLFLGIALHGRPVAYMRSFSDGVRSIGPLLLQFPLYGGIMGLVMGSGLGESLARSLISLANSTTLPFWTFLSAGVVNVFVPSGGGQWAVQGPVALKAALDSGVSREAIAMAVAWGDQWTNMIQPMWALPILALAGKQARDIMGYCTVSLLASGIVFGLGTFLL